MDQSHENVCAVGRVAKILRKMVVFSIYIPLILRVQGQRAMADSLSTEIASIRAAIKDPIIVIGGDFNRRDFSVALREAADLVANPTCPTREGSLLDIIYTKFPFQVTDTRVLPPLQSDWCNE